ncbi:MAG: glycosyltransferase family 39 protein [Lachnospiraceae bacterium]|nr:glycosyltransferase family 39 protein [Lachnospiraceae bacterium]
MREDKKRIDAVWGRRLIWTVYFAGFFVMALVMVFSQPHVDRVSAIPVSPPDEYFRMLIPKFICEHGTLPTGLEEEVRITGCGFSYGLYNVLPYIIQGYVMRLVNLFTDSGLVLLYAGRMVNVAFGMFMAWVVYLLGGRLFKDQRFRILFCFAVMYLPEHLFVHTYINTDSCCMLSTAMILYGLVCAYQDGFHYRNGAWLGGGIILCALSYYNAYGYILSSMILFVGYYIKKDKRLRIDWKPMLKYGIFISVLVLLGTGWWFIRTYIVLDGDILGLRTKEQLALLYALEETSPLNTYQAKGIGVWQMLQENKFFQCLYDSFIAAYGSLGIRGNRWTYLSYKLFFGAGILGWAAAWIFDKELRKIKGRQIFFHLNMMLCAILPLVIMINYAYTMNYQHQGRYILPSLLPIMYYTVGGIERLSAVRIKKFLMPDLLVNAGIIFALFIAVGSAVYMVFFQALPVYLEFGMTY